MQGAPGGYPRGHHSGQRRAGGELGQNGEKLNKPQLYKVFLLNIIRRSGRKNELKKQNEVGDLGVGIFAKSM